ncbi:chorismate--pyruvate lyase family protein [Mycobacterium riyadhense]|uniref:Chorismate pyruvate-lyase n=1 Tax=Mycobacterium riyadhense TaxID=486698 RepID=A0A653EVA3_9MYCO|nr:chorismate pyruvate-lyase family protein [Mycobacterium riyadhense]VTP01269.1 Chorismate pyruvate-lyase [Mycobacterium riyadhense]
MIVDATNAKITNVFDAAARTVGDRKSPCRNPLRKRPVRRRFLAAEEVRELSRDLRMLIATNGTLTGILGIVIDDDIDVEIVEQQSPSTAPETAYSERSIGGSMQRRFLLKGRCSGNPFVAVEALIAVDLLPPALVTSLMTTHRPLCELMISNGVESYRETAKVWMGKLPTWAASGSCQDSGPTVGRQYRTFIGGKPALIITEYFPLHAFSD